VTVRGALARALVGNGVPHGTAVIEFPDMASVESWLASAEYQAIIPVREQGCDMELLAYEQSAA
jgi:uncharacterized protein (DUF1330 family)